LRRIRKTSPGRDLTGVNRENEGRVDKESPGVNNFSGTIRTECVLERSETNYKK
jgi:hypothetical protein